MRQARLHTSMRILYDHQAFSLQNLGGITVYYFELATRLSHVRDVSAEVHLGLHNSVYSFEEAAVETGLRVVGWRSKMRPGLERYAVNEVLTGAIAAFSGQYDVYHTTLYRRMPTVRARVTVATNHDCTQERYPEFFKDAGRVTRAKRALYRETDMIFCVSKISQRDVLTYYNVDPARTRVINQGVPHLRRDPDSAREFIASLRRPYLLYVGARYSYKNFAGLVEAFATGGFSQDYDLIAVGGGNFTQAEKSEIARHGVERAVLQWGFVNDAVLAEAYSRATLFVSPSFYEGFGLPPLEALTVGCPVLASSTASVPEICGDAAMYFNPTQPGDLVRGLGDALNDPERDGRRIRGFIQAARYSWQTNAEKTLAVYRELLGQ